MKPLGPIRGTLLLKREIPTAGSKFHMAVFWPLSWMRLADIVNSSIGTWGTGFGCMVVFKNVVYPAWIIDLGVNEAPGA